MPLLHCQTDGNSYVKTLTATVLSCEPSAVPPPSASGTADAAAAAGGGKKGGKADKKQKKNKKNKSDDTAAAAAADGKPPQVYYDIKLSDSVLFPVGGGQLADEGTLTTEDAATSSSPASVVHVYRTGDDVVHQTTSPVTVGATVDVAVDWKRRWDLMQQHTAQHLISAVCRNQYQLKTVSWWMSREGECTIDLEKMGAEDAATSMTDAEFADIEQRVDAHIHAAHPIKVHIFDDRAAAMADTYFTSNNTKPVPEEFAGQLRVVEIKDVDFNTCCGTHLQSTHHLRVVHLTRHEKVAKGGLVRLSFLAGTRAQAALASAVALRRHLSGVLSSAAADVGASVERLVKEQRDVARDRKALLTEVAALQGRQLVRAAQTLHMAAAAAASAKADVEGGGDAVAGDAADDAAPPIVVHYHRELSDSSLEVPFMTDVVAAIRQQESVLQTVLTNTVFMITTASSVLRHKDPGTPGCFLLVGPAAAVKSMGKIVAETTEGRGGGKPGTFQGKAARIDRWKAAATAIGWTESAAAAEEAQV